MLFGVMRGRSTRALLGACALIVGACSSGDDQLDGTCLIEDADGFVGGDDVVELRPDGSERLVGFARLAESFGDDAFGYVEGYRDDGRSALSSSTARLS